MLLVYNEDERMQTLMISKAHQHLHFISLLFARSLYEVIADTEMFLRIQIFPNYNLICFLFRMKRERMQAPDDK